MGIDLFFILGPDANPGKVSVWRILVVTTNRRRPNAIKMMLKFDGHEVQTAVAAKKFVPA